MAYLLKLIIPHKPKPTYDSLPNTEKQLLYIDVLDVTTFPIPSTDSTDDGNIFTRQAMLSQETQTNFSMTQLYPAETVTVAQELESEAEISNTNTTSRLPNTTAPASQARGTPSLNKRKRQKPKPLTKVLLLISCINLYLRLSNYSTKGKHFT
jgi:hypothetical protein